MKNTSLSVLSHLHWLQDSMMVFLVVIGQFCLRLESQVTLGAS